MYRQTSGALSAHAVALLWILLRWVQRRGRTALNPINPKLSSFHAGTVLRLQPTGYANQHYKAQG